MNFSRMLFQVKYFETTFFFFPFLSFFLFFLYLYIKIRVYVYVCINNVCNLILPSLFSSHLILSYLILCYLILGVASPALNQFLSQNLSEQGLTRLLKSVESACVTVESIFGDHIMRLSQCLIYRASELRGMSAVKDDFENVGLFYTDVDILVESCQLLALKAEEALREVQLARKNFKTFLSWLIELVMYLASAQGKQIDCLFFF